MTEIAHMDDVLHRAQQLETYVTLSEETLKSLRIMKQEADKIVGSLGHKKDELSRHEQDLVDYLKKLQLVSQTAEAALTPITEQKQELDHLSKKLAEGIERIDGIIQQKVEPLVEQLNDKVKALEDELHSTNETYHKGLDGSVAELLEKKDQIVKDLSQRVGSCEHAEQAQKALIDAHKSAVEREGKNIADLRKAMQEINSLIERQKHEFDGTTQKLSDELKELVEKQKEELSALMEKRHQEMSGTVAELNEKHVKSLEKDNAQIKSALNGIIAKLGNVKFKKILGL